MKKMSHRAALEEALFLALTAADEVKASQAVNLATLLAADGLSVKQIAAEKDAALARFLEHPKAKS